MPAKNNKKPSSSRRTPAKPKAPEATATKLGFRQRLAQRMRGLMSRRPHRSFRLTKRATYKRGLTLPGYWAFTAEVWMTLRRRARIFVPLALLYGAVAVLLGLMTSQTTYTQISDLFTESNSELSAGDFDSLFQAILLSVAAFGGGVESFSEVQQVYAVLLFLLGWLTTVWLLREYLAGSKPRLRDGLYNAGSPLVSTFLVLGALLLQLVPLGLLGVAYTALNNINLLTEGMPIFLFSILTLLVVTLTLYWITSTFIALIVVTLPGMYPMAALRTAGDLVIGRRLRILYRLLWLVGLLFAAWVVIMLPLVMLNGWLSGAWPWLASIPIVPFVAVALSAFSVVWSASYVYLLYRKVIDDDSAPA